MLSNIYFNDDIHVQNVCLIRWYVMTIKDCPIIKTVCNDVLIKLITVTCVKLSVKQIPRRLA